MEEESFEREHVFKVYDKIANWFSKNRDHVLIEKQYLDDVIKLIPADGEILDLGCGNGKPILEYLNHLGFKVTGVDASEKMLDLARLNFPQVTFLQEDMRNLQLTKKFDAIIAWHSFFHLPAADQSKMFSIFAHHLQENGILLFTSGTEEGEAWGFIGGEHLHHASLDPASYQSILLENNFTILKHHVNDESCGGATVWMAQYIPS
ncbi:methyltransferase domain-containing protein [Pedobacter petrophilus]|uniref:Methyltransferase domain-containing protein n=1 Tax=Pedobacter petrophilus TaxID=1908241 RepID=A0A7K0FU88_9SPHI|nr:class I SAM-dependent methyltransferase [Pedobacter petrophilus]MRX74961.1 methyltransferase domain-containing protein [Pedobacter petrophilus]